MTKGKRIAMIAVVGLAILLVAGLLVRFARQARPEDTTGKTTPQDSSVTTSDETTVTTPITTSFASTVTPEGMVRNPANLLDVDYYQHYDGQTIAGVEISLGQEGEIVLDGTSTGAFYLDLGYFKEGETDYYREENGPYCLGTLPLPIMLGDPPYYVQFPENCSMGIESTYENEGHWQGTYHWYNGAYWDETIYPYINETTEPEYVRFKVDAAGVVFDNFVLCPFLYYFDATGNFLKDSYSYYEYITPEEAEALALYGDVEHLVFNGSENWMDNGHTSDNSTTLYFYCNSLDQVDAGFTNRPSYCSHFPVIYEKYGIHDSACTDIGFSFSVSSDFAFAVRLDNTVYSDLDDWKSYLMEEYANGTPVTVWYATSAFESGTELYFFDGTDGWSTGVKESGVACYYVNTFDLKDEINITFYCNRFNYSQSSDINTFYVKDTSSYRLRFYVDAEQYPTLTSWKQQLQEWSDAGDPLRVWYAVPEEVPSNTLFVMPSWKSLGSSETLRVYLDSAKTAFFEFWSMEANAVTISLTTPDDYVASVVKFTKGTSSTGYHNNYYGSYDFSFDGEEITMTWTESSAAVGYLNNMTGAIVRAADGFSELDTTSQSVQADSSDLAVPAALSASSSVSSEEKFVDFDTAEETVLLDEGGRWSALMRMQPLKGGG